MESLLGRITAPIQSPTQHMQCTNYVRRINELDFEANNDLLTIEKMFKNNIDPVELAEFKTSMANIESRTSAADTSLCAWKVANTQAPIKASPSQSQTTSDTGANQAKQAYRQKEA